MPMTPSPGRSGTLPAHACPDWSARLMLARVDGKSPVEYLDAVQQDRVRWIARRILLDAPTTLDDLAGYLRVKA